MSRFLTSIFLIVLCTPSTGPAQTPVPAQGQRVRVVGPGDRVRVTTPDRGRYDGIVQAIPGDFLTVDTLTVPRASITRLEVHRGRKGHAPLGAAIGAVALGAVGVAAGIGLCESEFGFGGGCSNRGEAAAAGGGAGVVVGALLGAVTGSFIKTDRWEDVSLYHLWVGVVPQRDGFGITASIAF